MCRITITCSFKSHVHSTVLTPALKFLRLVYHVSRACMNEQRDGTSNATLPHNGAFSAGIHAHATIVRVVNKISAPGVADASTWAVSSHASRAADRSVFTHGLLPYLLKTEALQHLRQH